MQSLCEISVHVHRTAIQGERLPVGDEQEVAQSSRGRCGDNRRTDEQQVWSGCSDSQDGCCDETSLLQIRFLSIPEQQHSTHASFHAFNSAAIYFFHCQHIWKVHYFSHGLLIILVKAPLDLPGPGPGPHFLSQNINNTRQEAQCNRATVTFQAATMQR